MADDDDLARLMREIDEFDRASGSAPAQLPAKKDAPVTKRSSEVAESGSGSRMRWALIAAIAAGIVGFVVGTVLWIVPGVNGWSTGIGAALGGAIVALVSGPPRWLR